MKKKTLTLLIGAISFVLISVTPKKVEAQAFGSCKCETFFSDSQEESLDEIYRILNLSTPETQQWFLSFSQGNIPLSEGVIFPYENLDQCITKISTDCWAHCQQSGRNKVRSSFPKGANSSGLRKLSLFLKIHVLTLCTSTLPENLPEEKVRFFSMTLNFPLILQTATPTKTFSRDLYEQNLFWGATILILTALLTLVTFPAEILGGALAALLLTFGLTSEKAPKGFSATPPKREDQKFSLTLSTPKEKFQIEIDQQFQHVRITDENGNQITQ